MGMCSQHSGVMPCLVNSCAVILHVLISYWCNWSVWTKGSAQPVSWLDAILVGPVLSFCTCLFLIGAIDLCEPMGMRSQHPGIKPCLVGPCAVILHVLISYWRNWSVWTNGNAQPASRRDALPSRTLCWKSCWLVPFTNFRSSGSQLFRYSILNKKFHTFMNCPNIVLVKGTGTWD